MGNVANLRSISDFSCANTLNMGWLPHMPGYPLIEDLAIANQVENTENKQTIRLLKKRKFRNIEHI